jgi:hypothetical protein
LTTYAKARPGAAGKPKSKLENPQHRINRIVKKLATRRTRKQAKAEKRNDFRHLSRPLRRLETPELKRVLHRLKRIIAYDLETTNIDKGTPRPLYVTACGSDFWVSAALPSPDSLTTILQTSFLTPELKGTRFVAWNGNKFDVYFIAMALLRVPELILRPYMTRSKALRGLKVILRQYRDGVEITNEKGTKEIAWEFLDGIAMTGMAGKPLKDFLKTFAPDFHKLDAPDWEHETFDVRNPEHVRYAERDSEGLFYALMKVQDITLENFNIGLAPTIGNMGIKIFQRHMPARVECWKPPVSAQKVIRDQVMRGGFCFCVQRYRGPVWKYDINQAYAAAMREAWLPAGRAVWSRERNPYAGAYIARVRAVNPFNRIPFYYRDMEKGASVFALQEIGETWLTSIEIEQLEKEKWRVEILECWFWDSRFKMKDYVDRLEHLRIGGGRNPKDAQGEIMKAIGNNSYGKTVEQLEGLELLMAAEQPEDFAPYPTDESAAPGLQYVWYRFGEPMQRDYHQPQIGAFITAQVRMVVRRAALLSPDTWLYADTDCVMFSSDVTDRLNIDPGKYGAWKIEEQGTDYLIAAKKVYSSADGKTKHAKGMSVRKLTTGDFEKWIAGAPPEQVQIQRQNFMQVLAGFDMFVERKKVGERL